MQQEFIEEFPFLRGVGRTLKLVIELLVEKNISKKIICCSESVQDQPGLYWIRVREIIVSFERETTDKRSDN